MNCSDSKLERLNDSKLSVCRFPSIENMVYMDLDKLGKKKMSKKVVNDEESITFDKFVFPNNMKIFKEKVVLVKEKSQPSISKVEKNKTTLVESFIKRREDRINSGKNSNKPNPLEKKSSRNRPNVISSKTRVKTESIKSQLSIEEDSVCPDCPYCIEDRVMETKNLIKRIKISNDK
uniref:Uncharacterized protein n=1 Tax=Strongyloides venezuelensis TaxID=75913 RepID=A0A0K0F1F4_STRVS